MNTLSWSENNMIKMNSDSCVMEEYAQLPLRLNVQTLIRNNPSLQQTSNSTLEPTHSRTRSSSIRSVLPHTRSERHEVPSRGDLQSQRNDHFSLCRNDSSNDGSSEKL